MKRGSQEHWKPNEVLCLTTILLLYLLSFSLFTPNPLQCTLLYLLHLLNSYHFTHTPSPLLFYFLIILSQLLLSFIMISMHSRNVVANALFLIAVALPLTKFFHFRTRRDLPGRNNLIRFLISATVPVPTHYDKYANGKTEKRILSVAAGCICKLAIILFCYRAIWIWSIHPLINYYVLLWLTYFVFSSFTDTIHLLLEGFGVGVHPLFNSPFLATSPRNFWSKRWNFLVSDFFRDFLFIPITALLRPTVSIAVANAVSGLAVFAVSGLAHELLAVLGTGSTSDMGSMMTFFMVQGVVCLMEGYFRFPKVPRVLSVILFHVFLLLTGPLFIIPIAPIYQQFGASVPNLI